MRLSRPLRTALVLIPVIGALSLVAARSEDAVRIDPPKLDTPAAADAGLETAVLAGGCFWGVQAVFQHTKGVTNAVSGYAGGDQKDAEYFTVGSGTTGHAESVKVTFDPRVISYGKILQIYFSVAHDPTQLNRQGPDWGTQYRSEIFPQSETQKQIAKAYIAQLDAAHTFSKPIATRADTNQQAFYPAEEYHQDYATLHPTQPYIVYNDLPKVANLKTMFPDVWRDKPVLVAEAKGAGH